MRIDPKGTIAGYPSLQVRRALKRLHFDRRWNTARPEVAAALARADAGVGGSSLPWIPGAPVLLALRSLSLFERAESRDLTGGPQGRGRVRPSGTAPDPVCRWCLEAGRAAPCQGGPPPRNVVRRRAVRLMGAARAAVILR